MVIIQKIKIVRFAVFQAKLAALLGLLAGIIYSFGGAIIDTLVSLGWMVSTQTPGLSVGTALAFGALIGMPLIFAIGGFILGLIEAFLYNVCTRWVGKIDMDFKKS